MGSSSNESMFPLAIMALFLTGSKTLTRNKYLSRESRIYHNPAFGIEKCLFTDVESDPNNTWVEKSGYLDYEIDKDTKFYGWDGWRTIYQLRVKKIMREAATMTLKAYRDGFYYGDQEVIDLKAGDAVWLAKVDSDWMDTSKRCPREYAGYESRRNLEIAFGNLWTGISRTSAYLPRDLIAQTTCFENQVVEIPQDGMLDLRWPICSPAYKVGDDPAYPLIGHGSVGLDMYLENQPVKFEYKGSSWDEFEGLKYILEDIAIDIGCGWIQAQTGIPKSICVAKLRGDSVNFETGMDMCKEDPDKCYDFFSSLL